MSDSQEISQVANLVMSIIDKEQAGPSSKRSTPLSSGKYMPERLLDFRLTADGRKIYLVKWFGYPHEENTWEYEKNLSCYYMMQEIEEKKKRPAQTVSQPSRTVTGTLTGFDLGHTPELILGATEKNGEIFFLIKWKGVFEADMIPRHFANILCPQLVIEFYEERLSWSIKHKVTEQAKVEEPEEEEIDVVSVDNEVRQGNM